MGKRREKARRKIQGEAQSLETAGDDRGERRGRGALENGCYRFRGKKKQKGARKAFLQAERKKVCRSDLKKEGGSGSSEGQGTAA